ncbi:TPA: hypothetical protein U1B40_001618 [Streptococcus suis]|uniref:hypothetical protein n=1 Tax=Streptococcus suis TaxID=1307 RepID=UPI0010A9F51E|nr:hypothetical protein [Streptococcus suis]MBM7137813.1 hypothetical protein [Streptococcus suis]MBM7317996.1 hypothetical protein [Streptococcus suis]MBY4600595.1 hypothetical protein [Streptococcus suis]MBY4963909.1 hypothetical protein [Streptococcus suis]MCO8172636.1 hypothetical protein [Streptococcus suis]
MYSIVEVTIKRGEQILLDLLKDNPTRAVMQNDFFRFYYYLPFGSYITPFSLNNIILKVFEEIPAPKDWELIRDYPISIMKTSLLVKLEDIEKYMLDQQRQASGLYLDGWVFDTITNGIYTKEETAIFIRQMYLYGYDFEQVVSLFTAIVKRSSLASYFLDMMKRLYFAEDTGNKISYIINQQKLDTKIIS